MNPSMGFLSLASALASVWVMEWRPAFRTAATTPPGRLTSELAINAQPNGLCPPLCQAINYLLRKGRLFHRDPLIFLSDLIKPGKFRFHTSHYFCSYRHKIRRSGPSAFAFCPLRFDFFL
jgi:hypothetical protein